MMADNDKEFPGYDFAKCWLWNKEPLDSLGNAAKAVRFTSYLNQLSPYAWTSYEEVGNADY